MRVDARRLAPVAMLVAALAAPAARSDGGRVCASQAEDGVRATLLTSPTPLRVGRAELVLVVEDAGGRAADLAAGVRLRLRAADGSVRDLDAARSAGAGGEVYAATADFGATGPIEIEARAGRAAARCRIEVEPAAPRILAHWPLVAFPPLAVALFVTSRLLARRRPRRPRQLAA